MKKRRYIIPPIFHRYQWPFYWAMMERIYDGIWPAADWTDQEHDDAWHAYCMGGEL